ncbi:hypothetical protein [Novosphingobium sp. BL-52-GroH]|uniref:hypothetical protein n=1 Tax=Novosphingobium sp. BL-52-GroH TaxID=3349877 RepID=UPI00384B7C1B
MAIVSAPAPDGPEALGGKHHAALAILATVFFMWAFITVLNDILIPHLKAGFELNYIPRG